MIEIIRVQELDWTRQRVKVLVRVSGMAMICWIPMSTVYVNPMGAS